MSLLLNDTGDWDKAFRGILSGNSQSPPIELTARRKNGAPSYLEASASRWQSEGRTFVTAIREDGEGSPVAAAVINMSSALGLLTSAEGVEEPQQLEGLRKLGCDIAQGFLFAKPLPAEDAEQMLRNAPVW